jgi:hypothetical protein
MDKLKNLISPRVADEEQALNNENTLIENKPYGQPPSYAAEESTSENANTTYGAATLPLASVMSKAVLLTELKYQSQLIHCPYCSKFVYTKLDYQGSIFTYLLFFFTFAVGFDLIHEYAFLFLLLLPGTVDIGHKCPCCTEKLAIYSIIKGISITAPVATV